MRPANQQVRPATQIQQQSYEFGQPEVCSSDRNVIYEQASDPTGNSEKSQVIGRLSDDNFSRGTVMHHPFLVRLTNESAGLIATDQYHSSAFDPLVIAVVGIAGRFCGNGAAR